MLKTFAILTVAIVYSSAFCADIPAAIASTEKEIEAKRIEAGIPGTALAVIKGGSVVLSRGFGFRDAEKKLPVTRQTLFAIGSTSKAFTAMSVMISADEGKLSLEDSPKKLLPYFELQDSDADQKITIRDLLTHRSGLAATDICWLPGKLTREEVIRVAGVAKPTAKYGEKWQYQNVMYCAAGECAAAANKTTWEEFVKTRIFTPLKMNNSNFSVKEMQKSADFSLGYILDEKKSAKSTPMRDLASIAPAGAINSNITDMSQWLMLMILGGEFSGKRIISEASFKEILKPQMQVAPSSDYTLGWLKSEFEGRTVYEHSGGIDGFGAYVAFMPSENLGFVELSNVMMAPHTAYREIVFSNFYKKPKEEVATAPAADPNQEVGRYEVPGFAIEVKMEEGALYAHAPAQPPYKLMNLGGRRYKLGEPAPAGFFATFRQSKDGAAEMYLEQPQGNMALAKANAAADEAANTAYNGPLKELLGRYEMEGFGVEIALKNGTVCIVVAGQPPYPLSERKKDIFAMGGLPDGFEITVRRGADKKVSGIFMKQPRPQPDMELKRAVAEAGLISVDELLKKMIEAAGGEARLSKTTSSVTTVELDFENQGITAAGTVYSRAPNSYAVYAVYNALNKEIGKSSEFFDGENGGSLSDFQRGPPLTKEMIAQEKVDHDFHQLLNLRTHYPELKVKEKTKYHDESVFVLEGKGPAGRLTAYVSEQSFRVMKRERDTQTHGGRVEVNEKFSDYREVNGVFVPFTTVQKFPGLGTLVTRVKEVKFNAAIPDSVFKGVKP